MGRGIVMLVGAVVEGGGGCYGSLRVLVRVLVVCWTCVEEIESGRSFERVGFYGDEKD